MKMGMDEAYVYRSILFNNMAQPNASMKETEIYFGDRFCGQGSWLHPEIPGSIPGDTRFSEK
jgi:hypothetical protein